MLLVPRVCPGTGEALLWRGISRREGAETYSSGAECTVVIGGPHLQNQEQTVFIEMSTPRFYDQLGQDFLYQTSQC